MDIKEEFAKLQEKFQQVCKENELLNDTRKASVNAYADLLQATRASEMSEARDRQVLQDKLKEVESKLAECTSQVADLTAANDKLTRDNTKLVQANLAKDEVIESLHAQLLVATRKKPSRWQRFKRRVRALFG
ncbi:uncharacterized protein LOC116612452 isoform X2 [Nematostella vectensis]|uniref:uncharacterized protein LOC116612452 isoform X2 n=1 Tax=Nematostella vectensis TaxID=45351 RepID=UPI00138FC3D3|nr:uncharacterized protein LOC116612452 isoform X2 [Nematostella vectensis]